MENIIENNKLIAEFMGMTVNEDGICKPYPKVPGEYFQAHNFDVWKVGGHLYSTSWDWLMPVVEKIEGIKGAMFEVMFKRERIQIRNLNPLTGVPTIALVPTVDIENDFVRFPKIEAVYSAVVQFITWYNQTTLPYPSPSTPQ